MSPKILWHQMNESRRRFQRWTGPQRERLNRFWDSLSMRAKLSILFSGLILAMTAFFYGFAVYQTTREIKISAIYKGQAIAEALKGEVAYAIQSKTFPNLDFTFRRLASSRNDVAYVFLMDPSGQILSDSEPEQVGR